MAQGSAVSIYLNAGILEALDAYVEKQANKDRAQGLSGYQVASRSKVIADIVEDFLLHQNEGVLTIEEIKEVVSPIAHEYGVERLSLFGSYARGEGNRESDIDFLLEKGNVKGMQVFDLKEDLERALDATVDIVTTTGAHERFLKKIGHDEIVLYERY